MLQTVMIQAEEEHLRPVKLFSIKPCFSASDIFLVLDLK